MSHHVVAVIQADHCRQQLKPMVVPARNILKRMKKSDKVRADFICLQRVTILLMGV